MSSQPMQRRGVDERVLFDALLTPHRSLSARGFAILMAAVCAVGLVGGLIFLLAGAWPVIGFLGLDVALIYFAFRINYRRAAMTESLRLTSRSLTVRRMSDRGRVSSWSFQPYWLQVLMDDPPRHDSQLTLRTHGRSITIGSFLTPGERLDLARALRRALDTARTFPAPPCAPAR